MDKTYFKNIMNDQPIIFTAPLPEYQVKPPYVSYHNPILGDLIFTSGFMEPYGHGLKVKPRRAINRQGKMFTRSPGNYNIGFDYTKGFKSQVLAWYSGEVILARLERGYGNRIYMRLDMPFYYQGNNYTCYQAYAHNTQLIKRIGDKVNQGEEIALEGGHDGKTPYGYGSHVDLDTYFYLGKEKIHLNPELLATQLNFPFPLTILKKGDTGLGVHWLQYELNLKQDGIFGERTETKVKEFQSKHNLKPDGIVGRLTVNKINPKRYFLLSTVKTVLKQKPIQSTFLKDSEKMIIDKNTGFSSDILETIDNHYKFEYYNECRYLYTKHTKVLECV